MRDIVSPLAGFSSPFGRGADPYAILGYKPPLVLDYENSKFRVSGSTSTAPSVVTATRTGLATQLDASGNLVWNAHNLALNSATPATQSITVISGADYTVECTGSGSITLSGAGTGSVTEGNPVEITASTTTLTLTVVGSLDTMWAYRSDLGGMAPVPLTRRVAGSTTYVPTTSAAVYLPREEAYTYVSGSLVGPYYQKESDARTNLVTYSEDFTHASWSKTNTTISADQANALTGNSDASKIVEDDTGASSAHFIQKSATISSGATVTCSVFLKSAERSGIRFIVRDATAAGNGAFADNEIDGNTEYTAPTTFGTGWTAIGYEIENYGNGWFRHSITAQAPAVTTVYIQIQLLSGSSTTYDGDGTSGILIYGAQLEQGSTPSSYIPTSGSTVTRSADSTTISAANMPAYTDALSFQMDGLMTYADDSNPRQVRFCRWEEDANNNLEVFLTTGSAAVGQTGFAQEASGVVDFVLGANDDYSPGINVPFNIASRHGSTFINGAVDGTALTADTTPTALPDLSATTFDLAPTFNGFIKEFRVWADDIGDTGIAEAST